jgi:predicted O-methyltransferase YrrM
VTSVLAEPKWQHDGTKRTEGEVLDLLHSLVRCQKPAVVIETGTFAGHGTQAIFTALERNEYGHLWTVENDPVLYEAYPDDSPRTTYVEGDSLAFVTAGELPPPDLAFVDCGEWEHRVHVAQETKRILNKGGLMLVHDTEFYPELLPAIRGLIGAPQLHLPTLHGVTIWLEEL